MGKGILPLPISRFPIPTFNTAPLANSRFFWISSLVFHIQMRYPHEGSRSTYYQAIIQCPPCPKNLLPKLFKNIVPLCSPFLESSESAKEALLIPRTSPSMSGPKPWPTYIQFLPYLRDTLWSYKTLAALRLSDYHQIFLPIFLFQFPACSRIASRFPCLNFEATAQPLKQCV